MSVLHQLRAYHALLAVLVVAAYLTGEMGRVHAWLGYGVAAVIVLRIIMALTGLPQLGLMRFYPHFEGLKLDHFWTHPSISRALLAGIAVCLITVTSTGIFMDKGRTFGFNKTQEAVPLITKIAENDDDEDEKEKDPVEEVHEFFGNALMLLVAAHVTYLFTFKRPLARFMVFNQAVKRREETITPPHIPK